MKNNKALIFTLVLIVTSISYPIAYRFVSGEVAPTISLMALYFINTILCIALGFALDKKEKTKTKKNTF